MFTREIIRNAVHFWERARVIFNVLMLGYVLFRFGAAIARMPGNLWSELLAVVVFANVVFSAAYLADLPLQATDYQHMWRTFGRPVLWLLLASIAAALVDITLTLLLNAT